MTIAGFAAIVSIEVLGVLILFCALAATTVRRNRAQRREPLIAAGRAALVGIAATGKLPATRTPNEPPGPNEAPGSNEACADPWLRLQTSELIMIFSELAPSVDGDSLTALRAAAAELGLVTTAHRQLGSWSWVRRLGAARFLTAIGAPTTQRAIALFKDPHPAVRTQAASWVSISKDGTAIEYLVTLLTDPDGRCRFAAKDALIRLGTAATPTLSRLLDSPDQGAVTAALEVAAAVGDASFTAQAVRLAGSGLPEHRALAAAVLGATGGPLSAPALPALLRDPDATVRRAATSAVAQLGDWSAAAAVTDLLGDPDWPVRRDAGLALLRLGAPGLVLLREAAAVKGNAVENIAASVARQALQLHLLTTQGAA
jgi:hypothetical protein